MLIMIAKHVNGWIILQCPNVLFESTVDCRTPQDAAVAARTDHCAITDTLNYDQLQMTHSIEGQKAKHINFKFEDVGLKRRFCQRLYYYYYY